jgi:hypothetical protein
VNEEEESTVRMSMPTNPFASTTSLQVFPLFSGFANFLPTPATSPSNRVELEVEKVEEEESEVVVEVEKVDDDNEEGESGSDDDDSRGGSKRTRSESPTF